MPSSSLPSLTLEHDMVREEGPPPESAVSQLPRSSSERQRMRQRRSCRRTMQCAWLIGTLIVAGCVIAVVIRVANIDVLSSSNKNSNDDKNNNNNSPQLPNAQHQYALTEYINSITLTNQTILYIPSTSTTTTTTSAEEMALQWLIEYDPIVSSFFDDNEKADDVSSLSITNQTRIGQRYALLTLWFQQHRQSRTLSLNSSQQNNNNSSTTTSQKWTNTTGWLTTNIHECNWYGISCSSGGEVITGIQMPLNSIRGTIPPDLGLLSSLTTFRMNTNYIHGSLPSTIGRWTNLQSIALYKNSITGQIPSAIQYWTQVQTISLYENQFSSTIPSEIGSSSWKAITEFNVGLNNLTGPIPSTLGYWKETIQSVTLSVNALTGTIPTTLSAWHYIHEFRVASNALHGPIPEIIGTQWTQLQVAYFHGNHFTGSMPVGLCNTTIVSNLSALVADCASSSSFTCRCCTYCFAPKNNNNNETI